MPFRHLTSLIHSKVIISTVVLTNALNPITKVQQGDDKIKEVISKYIAKVPDIEEQYVIDERLSRAISHYFKGKISSFPLYKVSVKIDRNPVKIPWTLGDPKANVAKKPRALKKKDKPLKKRYKYEKIVELGNGNSSEKPIEKIDITTRDSHEITKSSTINTAV